MLCSRPNRSSLHHLNVNDGDEDAVLLPTRRVRVADEDVAQIAPLSEMSTATTTTLMANELTNSTAAAMADVARQQAQRRPDPGKERAFVGQAEPVVGVCTHRVAGCHGVPSEHRCTIVSQPGEMR